MNAIVQNLGSESHQPGSKSVSAFGRILCTIRAITCISIKEIVFVNGLEQFLLLHRDSINGSFPEDKRIKGLQGCCHSENCIFLLVTHSRGSYFWNSESHGNLHLVRTWLPTSGSWVTTSFQKWIWKIDVC